MLPFMEQTDAVQRPRTCPDRLHRRAQNTTVRNDVKVNAFLCPSDGNDPADPTVDSTNYPNNIGISRMIPGSITHGPLDGPADKMGQAPENGTGHRFATVTDGTLQHGDLQRVDQGHERNAIDTARGLDQVYHRAPPRRPAHGCRPVSGRPAWPRPTARTTRARAMDWLIDKCGKGGGYTPHHDARTQPGLLFSTGSSANTDNTHDRRQLEPLRRGECRCSWTARSSSSRTPINPMTWWAHRHQGRRRGHQRRPVLIDRKGRRCSRSSTRTTTAWPSNKPAGMLSQGDATGDPSVVDEVRGLPQGRLRQAGQRLRRPGPPARPPDLGRRSCWPGPARGRPGSPSSSATAQVAKTYLAVAEGAWPDDSGEWEDWLLKDERTNVVAAVPPGHARGPAGEPGLSGRRPPGRAGSTFELRPTTGRGHQLRVQLASRGLPIVGDRKYGARSTLMALDGRPRIALHARELRFKHPTRPEHLAIAAPIPADWPAGGSSGPR